MGDLFNNNNKYGAVSREATALSGTSAGTDPSSAVQGLGKGLEGAMEKAGDVVGQFMEEHGGAITGVGATIAGAATFARLMDPEHNFEL